MTATTTEPTLNGRTRDVLKRAGNPFRNYFARNPDDEVCARYHVPELFAAERDLLHAIIDLYRYDPMTHSEVLPVLGNKGAGKTHLLHSIKHGSGGQWQLLVTPGVYQKDSDFLEYLLFQIIDTLLGGGKQKGVRPLEHVSDQLVRRLLGVALRELTPGDKVELFPPPGLGRWARRLGLGTQQAQERVEWLAENLSGYSNFARNPAPLSRALEEAGLTPQKAFDLLSAYVQKTEAHNTAGLMRRHIYQGFARAALLKDEADLAGFLTYGFAELEFHVRPTRQDLVLALFKVLMEVFRSLKTPVVVAFDQLEDLLLARRSDDAHRTAESFFAGIVQVMHQIDGLCFLIFAERGLWNRFVPSLDGYIQDRLNNPVHVPKQGTVKAIRLEAPSTDLFRRVCEARLRPCLDELPSSDPVPDIFPFADEQVLRIAKTEPTLRDMLQQCRHLFDHLIYGPDDAPAARSVEATTETSAAEPEAPKPTPTPHLESRISPADMPEEPVAPSVSRVSAMLEPEAPQTPTEITFKRIDVVESQPTEAEELPTGTPIEEVEQPVADVVVNRSPGEGLPPTVSQSLDTSPTRGEDKNQEGASLFLPSPLVGEGGESSSRVGGERSPVETPVPVQQVAPEAAVAEVPPPLPFPAPVVAAEPAVAVVMPAPVAVANRAIPSLTELWDQEQRAARRKLEPEGALTGATRELQAGLGAFLSICHEHGVKVGPWRLQHVVPEFTFGEHPTYGAVTIAHWACKDGQPWKVGIGLFLARGAGKPKDLEVKLGAMEINPVMVDLLILLRPEDDLTMTGKSKTLWQDAERRGRNARLEAASIDGFAQLYSFPRWLAAVRESLPEGTPLPNLADIIQEKAEKLLEQVCMPVQG
ncbi:MAG: hypothetical protein K8U57_33245 [Planctomycetes bacterium]|nr:hypothetical protein [Planctomycetota bacterium]